MNNLKALQTFILLLLFICSYSLKAQIELNGHPIVHHVTCQHQELGNIEVHIKPTHPPYTFQWSTGATTEKITGLEPGNYSVTIRDANSTDTILNFVIEEASCQLTAQTFFTPNDDGINDRWFIAYSEYFKNALILVYNRMGQLVYQHRGEYVQSDEWDGTDLLGVPLPVSTYFFVIYPDKSNKKDIIKGVVSIIR